jgi:UDP-N-acetylglucosamine 1-carboxyvinyltransferase
MGNAPVELEGVPRVNDIWTTLKLFREMGVQAEFDQTTFCLDPCRIDHLVAPYDWVKRMRASVLCLGPLLGKYGEVNVSFPGGCAIGARPINLHLAGLSALGAEMDIQEGYVKASAKQLKGTRHRFPQVTVTGTANVLCAAVMAEGETVLENAACEPEVVDLCRFLKRMGATIHGEGTDTLTIVGPAKLGGARYRIMPDRIEWGTYAIAAAATGGEMDLRSEGGPYYLNIVNPLREAGVGVELGDDVCRVKAVRTIRPVSVTTSPYPGFPTDLQAQWMALMLSADGVSQVVETIFENRFMHVPELMRLGGQIELTGPQVATVRGTPGKLTGAEVMASDLRASASLVIAGLTAQGTTRIRRIYHLERGYEAMDQKLSSLGADIQRVKAPA